MVFGRVVLFFLRRVGGYTTGMLNRPRIWFGRSFMSVEERAFVVCVCDFVTSIVGGRKCGVLERARGLNSGHFSFWSSGFAGRCGVQSPNIVGGIHASEGGSAHASQAW